MPFSPNADYDLINTDEISFNISHSIRWCAEPAILLYAFCINENIIDLTSQVYDGGLDLALDDGSIAIIRSLINQYHLCSLEPELLKTILTDVLSECNLHSLVSAL